MPDKKIEHIGYFYLAFDAYKHESGNVSIAITAQTEKMPIEVAIQKLKAQLRKMEDEYYAGFLAE